MSHQENQYVTAFNSLDQAQDEIKEAFDKRAKKDGTIPNESILDLLNDISVILALDCEEAKYFFSKQNKAVPSGFNLNMLKYEQFINLFELWLKDQAKNLGGGDHMMHKLGQPGVPMSSVMSGPLKYGTVEPKQQENNSVQSPNYKENKRLLDLLVNAHKSEFREIYSEKLQEGQEKLPIQDCFIFLQDCFYLDGIEIKETSDADEDFFRSVNSYKRLFKIVEGYLLSKGTSPEELNLASATLSFDECFKTLDYWFKTNSDVVLVDNRQEVKDEGAVKKALLATIANYESMLQSASNEVEKIVLQKTIDTLKAQLVELDNASPKKDAVEPPQDDTDMRKREERKTKAIKEIFDYYCSQQLLAGKGSTFDRLDRLANTITLGTFRVFLKNFKLKVPHHKVIELYHKAAAMDENLQYSEFIELLSKIAVQAEFASEQKVHQPRPEIMKDYNPTSYKADTAYKNHLQTEAKKREEAVKAKRLPKVVYKDGAVRGEENLEEVWEHMGLYDGTYKDHIGQVSLPFNTHEKQNFRFPTDSPNYKFKAQGVEGKTAEEVQQDIHKRNELRKLIKDLKTLEKSFLMNYKNPNGAKGLPPQGEKEDVAYAKKLRGRPRPGPDISKMSLKKIENIFYGDIRTVDEKFNPHDLIDENDEEDNVFLAEYNIQTEKKRIKDKDASEKRKLEEYGKIRKAAKGFAVNGKYGHVQPSSSPGPQIRMDPLDMQDYDQINYAPLKGSYNSAKNIKSGAPGPTYLDYNESPTHNTRSVRNSQIYAMPKLSSGYDGYSGAYASGPNNGGRNNSYGPMGEPVRSPGYNQAIDRANQVENDVRKREKQMMSNIANIQSSQVQKGLKAVGNRH